MRLLVDLFDAPLPTEGDVHVNLAIDGLDAVGALTVQPLASYATPQMVDLLTLQEQPLAISGSVPAGAYTALRLLVDASRSNVTVNGKTYPMVFPHKGRHQSAVVAIDAKMVIAGIPGSSFNVAVDFNVLESIQLRGDYAYMTPKLVSADKPGRISGRVLNAAGAPVKSATVVATDSGGAVLNTTITKGDGSFTLHAIQAGYVHIAVLNSYVTAGGEAVVASGATATTGPTDAVWVAPSDTLDIGTLAD